MSRAVAVTGTQASIKLYSKTSQMAHQMARRTKELKRSVEAALLANQARNNGNSTTARTDSSAQRALTATLINTVMQSCYTEGGEPDRLMVGPFNKTVVSTLTGRSIAREMIDSNTAGSNVTVFATDFGDLQVMPNRFQRERDAFLISPEFAKVSYLRNFQVSTLGKTSDAETKHLVVEMGLEMTQEAAHGGIYDLTTS